MVGNIVAFNNMSFSDEDLLVEGKKHDIALHISLNCKSDALSNVLIDNGSSLNVILKSTLTKLKYQGPPIRPSGITVKPFDVSRKFVIGEVDLHIHIVPYLFQITFQVMDIFHSYSCLLGQYWI